MTSPHAPSWFARRPWRRFAHAHGLGYRPQAPVPHGPEAGAPFTRGVERHVSHELTGAVPATVDIGQAADGGRVRPVRFTSRSYHARLPMAGSATASFGAHHVLDVTLPVALPGLTLADAGLVAVFGLGAGSRPASGPDHELCRELHRRFEVFAAHPSFAHSALNLEVSAALLALPADSWVSLDGARLRMVSTPATSPALVWGRLALLAAVVAALPPTVWQAAGLRVAAAPARACGWENGLPGNRPSPLSAGPTWR